MDQKLQKDVHEEIEHNRERFDNPFPFRQNEDLHPFERKKL